MTTTQQTFKIRTRLPSGKWGPERKVTIAQYRAEMDEAKRVAGKAFQTMYPTLNYLSAGATRGERS